jgi:hypothetical protein
MHKYQQGKVYKITCNITNKVYIGSTCEPTIEKRLATHIQDYKKWLNAKKNYVTSYQILEQNDYAITLLELCPCNNNIELRMCERKWFDLIPNVNSVKPYISEKEKDTKEEKAIKRKIDYEKNKEIQNEQRRQRYLKNKEKEINQTKLYHEKHKEERNTQAREKFNCECGGKYTLCSKSVHFKSKKHQNYLFTLS